MGIFRRRRPPPASPKEAKERYLSRPQPDEAAMAARRRRNAIGLAVLIVVVPSALCCLVGLMMGVWQSFAGQWWMKPPRYPGAVQVDFREGEVCLTPSPSVYCYEWFYRTNDSVETVKAYYEKLDWWGHPKMTFEWRKGRRFTPNWVTESCIHIISNVCCYQIIVHPSGQGDTEVYILERGAMGDIRAGDK